MAQVPLGVGAYSRPYGRLPEIRCENRFFEQNPIGAEKVSLLSRPGSKLFLDIGDGPIRTLFSQPGVFSEDLFIVSGEELYRYDGENAPTLIDGVVGGLPGFPVMTSLAIPEWEAVFVTDGLTLQYYEGEGRATGHFSATGIVDGDIVQIDTTYYEFTDDDVNAGSQNGSNSNPWLVKVGATLRDSVLNLFNAINTLGVAGVNYGTQVEIHPSVRAFELEDDSFNVRANDGGTGGNSIATVATGADMTWGAATLEGGGGHELKLIPTPDNISFVDLTSLASHVIAVEKDSRRFFWIRPGEVVVDALDFSSAESEPDHILNIAAVGDHLWLFGQSSTEAWYASGDADQPFLRSQGRAFSQGIIPGTFAQINDVIFVVGRDRVVYRIAGGPERISHHGIEERIRLWQESLAP